MVEGALGVVGGFGLGEFVGAVLVEVGDNGRYKRLIPL
jgi:hypothetical protein